MAETLRTVDPATEPFLSGRFAPVRDEISADHLPVAGTLPDDLVGHYFRNGPNPEFTPLGSYTFRSRATG
jgi:carotenoid cleavage dioxygenase-like enzyme